jgi:hypothetical protein
MGKGTVAAALSATVGALALVGAAVAAPDNKNSSTVGMTCDHGVGSITGATIDNNNSGTFNLVDPGPGAYAVKRVTIDGQLVYENPGIGGRLEDLVRCVPMSLNGLPLPAGSPAVVFWGILNGG